MKIIALVAEGHLRVLLQGPLHPVKLAALMFKSCKKHRECLQNKGGLIIFCDLMIDETAQHFHILLIRSK